ncbi:MAG: copper amine oxidase N-terminal domain-containing protein [Cellulosilyticaceae bacterium]
MKKALYTLMMVIFLSVSIMGEVAYANPCFKLELDRGENIEDEQNWVYNFTFDTNQVLTLKNNADYTFLMINGTFIPDATLINNENHILLPIKTIGNALGFTTKFNNTKKNVTLTNENSTLTIANNEKVISVNGKQIISPVSPYIINGTMYVPLEVISKIFPVYTQYIPYDINKDYLHLMHPIVTIHKIPQKTLLTKEQAIKLSKKTFNTLYLNLLNNKVHNNGSKQSKAVLLKIKQDIDGIKYIDEISCYWVLEEGPYILLVDKLSGNLFFTNSKINRYYLQPVDSRNKQLLISGYFTE